MKHVLVLNAQVPFLRGGAEILAESLVANINKVEGVRAELATIPFKWYPEKQLLNDIATWRLVDITESNGVKIDLVVPTKFPTYAVKHPNKVPWLVHQHRFFYDLEGKPVDSDGGTPFSRQLRNEVRQLDNLFFKECRSIYTISDVVTQRLHTFNGFESTPLLPPPQFKDHIQPAGYDAPVLYFGRLNELKRPDNLIRAAALVPNAQIEIVGMVSQNQYWEYLTSLVRELKLESRCLLTGYVDDATLLQKIGHARAVFYGPVDEDYGYAAIEAFLARKPVLTHTDSGFVTIAVEKTGAGYISEPTPEALAEHLSHVCSLTPTELETTAAPGHEYARSIDWGPLIEQLVLNNL